MEPYNFIISSLRNIPGVNLEPQGGKVTVNAVVQVKIRQGQAVYDVSWLGADKKPLYTIHAMPAHEVITWVSLTFKPRTV